MEEVIRPILNLVYDEWDNDVAKPNCLSKFPEKQLSDPEFLILHYQNDASKQYKFEKKKWKIEDVENKPDENFYYFVDYGGNHLFEFLLDDKDVPTYDFLNPIVLEHIRNFQNFKVVFLTEHEPDNEKSFVAVMEYIKHHELNPKQFYLINNNAILTDYPVKHKFDINTHSLDFISHSSTKVLSFVGGCNFITNKTGKFFMCFNKSPKVHRYGLLCYLKKNNLLDDINWSLVPSWNAKPNSYFYLQLFNREDIFKFQNEIDFFEKTSIKRSDFEEDKGWFNEYQHINNKEFPLWLQIPEYMLNYESSYVNIVTESRFLDEENNIHISEKSFRPFYYYQFPLILATHNHIKKMKERFDLDFFDDILDHSYDSQPNQRVRLEMFYNEIKRLHGMKNELIDFYSKNYERFESNKQKVLKILSIVDKDYYFFESLI